MNRYNPKRFIYIKGLLINARHVVDVEKLWMFTQYYITVYFYDGNRRWSFTFDSFTEQEADDIIYRLKNNDLIDMTR